MSDLRILFVEDEPADVELCLHFLKKAGVPCLAERVDDLETFRSIIQTSFFDVILADYNLPGWTGMAAIEELAFLGKEIPLILVTGRLGEERAVECLKRGASDYVLKDNLARLPRAITRALEAQKMVEERRRTQEELVATKDAAESANRAKSEFLAVMSHEIRTPLNAIIGMADLLSETNLTTEQLKYVNVFQRAGETLLVLINDFLDLSKIEHGKIALEEVNFDLHALISKVADLLSSGAVQKGLDLSFRIAPGTPLLLAGDSHRLRQIVMNLVGNAIKFTERGSVRIEASAGPGSSPTDCTLLLEVTDTGIGIQPEKLEAVFDSFTQADSSTTRRYGGTGLGLTLSRALAKKMGGTLSVTSVPGQGSTFAFAAPFRLQTAPEISEAPRPAPIDLTGARILLVGGSTTDQVAVSEYLKGWGAVVTEVHDPTALFETLRAPGAARGDFDLMLIDDAALGGAVPEQLTALRREQPAWGPLPAVIVTSRDRSDAAALCRDFAPADFVMKPVRRAQLHQALTRALPSNRGAIAAQSLRRPVRLLLCDDSNDNAFLVREYLRGGGYLVDHASNGQIGFEMFRDGQFDCVLMDMQMPVMDGYAATRAIRSWEAANNRRPVPVIASTACVFPADVQKTAAAGCTSFIGKPMRKAELLNVLAGLCIIVEDGALPEMELETAPEVAPGIPPGAPEDLPAEILRAVPAYLKARNEDLHRISAALAVRDFETIRAIGHDLKGTGASFGFPEITDAGAHIESAARASDPDEIDGWLARIESCVAGRS